MYINISNQKLNKTIKKILLAINEEEIRAFDVFSLKSCEREKIKINLFVFNYCQR